VRNGSVVTEQAGGWHLKKRFRVPIPDAVNLSGQLLKSARLRPKLVKVGKMRRGRRQLSGQHNYPVPTPQKFSATEGES